MSIVSAAQALQLLQIGDVVGVPTETVYGLAGRIDSEAALQSIFATKGRPFFDPLIVHVADVGSARALSSSWPKVYDVLAARFWPGPLTLVAAKSEAISSLITSGLSTVALRSPNHPLALQLLRELSVPFAAPSANRFGRTSPTAAAHVESEFGGRVAVLDGGPCMVGVESTVLAAEQCEDNSWLIKILRPGSITRVQIAEALQDAAFNFKIVREASPASPGNLKAHYQPDSPVIILRAGSWNSAIQIQAEVALGRKILQARELILPATPQLAARVLYEELRRLSNTPDEAIFVVRKPAQDDPSWEAIWDRLERASTVIL